MSIETTNTKFVIINNPQSKTINKTSLNFIILHNFLQLFKDTLFNRLQAVHDAYVYFNL